MTLKVCLLTVSNQDHHVNHERRSEILILLVFLVDNLQVPGDLTFPGLFPLLPSPGPFIAYTTDVSGAPVCFLDCSSRNPQCLQGMGGAHAPPPSLPGAQHRAPPGQLCLGDPRTQGRH